MRRRWKESGTSVRRAVAGSYPPPDKPSPCRPCPRGSESDSGKPCDRSRSHSTARSQGRRPEVESLSDAHDPGEPTLLSRRRPGRVARRRRLQRLVPILPAALTAVLIRRDFPIRRVKLVAGLDVFNVFNTVVFGGINTNITSTAFGRVSSQVNTPRVAQLKGTGRVLKRRRPVVGTGRHPQCAFRGSERQRSPDQRRA